MKQRPLLLRNRDFALVWLSQVLSQGGTRMYQIGLLWWLLGRVEEGQRGLASGLFLLIAALPAVLLANRIGAVLSRTPSRSVMLRAELVAGGVVSLLAYCAMADLVATWAVYPVALVLAVCQAFVDPTLTKSVPEIVDEADVEEAVAFETATQSLANFGGAVFGAVVIDALGFVGVVILNALSYLLSSGLLYAARFRPLPLAAEPDAAVTPEPQAASAWGFLSTMPFVRSVLVCFAVANFFASPVFLVMPLYTKLVLEADAAVLAQLEASLWLGLLIGAFSGRLVAGVRRIVWVGAACLGLYALAFALPGLVASQPVYMLSLAAGGWCLGLNNVKFVTLFQQLVPPAGKGRFFALLQAAVGFSFPMAALAFGLLGDHLSPQTLCLVQAMGLAAVAVALLTLREPAPSLVP